MSNQQIVAPPSPYKGLAPFEDSSADALFFFGRERESEIVAANLLAYRLTVLYGASGVGKSSLLGAGVAYRLRQQGEAVVVFDNWSGDPVPSLLDEVGEKLAIPGLDDHPDGLAETLGNWTAALGRELYVILDQFDEYFLYHENNDGFAGELATVSTRPGLRVNVLISIRDDMLSRLDRFKALIPNLLSNYLRLDHLDRRAARDAILGPLDRYNALVPSDERMTAEAELVEAVLDGSGSDGRIEAPYLQLVMERLWEAERVNESRTLSLATLERLGGAAEIVRSHLAEALEKLSPGERELAAKLFNHLVTPSGTKIAHGIRDLAQYAAVSEGEVTPVVAALVDERIVRPVDETGAADGSRYEIFHDVLADPVVAWRSRYEAERELNLTRADARRRHRRLLILAGVALLAVAVMVGLTVFAFDQRSTARDEARRAHARELSANGLVGLQADPQVSLRLALAAAQLSPGTDTQNTLLTILAHQYERRVLRQGAPVRRLAYSPRGGRYAVETARAVHLYASPARSIKTVAARGEPIVFGADGSLVPVPAAVRGHGSTKLLALSRDGKLAVVASHDQDEGTRAGIYAARTGRLLHLLPEKGIAVAAISPDGRVVATGSADDSARLWSAASGRELQSLQHVGAVTALDFSRDGHLLATASRDGVGRVWDARTGSLVALLPGAALPLSAVALSDDARFVVTGSDDGKAYVYRVADGLLLAPLAASGGPVMAVAFSPSASTVLTGSDDRTVRIWDPGVADQLHVVRRVQSPVIATFSSGGQIVLRPLTGTPPSSVTSPDGRFTARAEGTKLFLTDRRTGRTEELRGHFSKTYALAFSPDSRWLVTGGQFAAILWRIGGGSTAERFALLYGHEPKYGGRAANLVSVAFSPDGRRIVTSSLDRTVRLYDCELCGGLKSLIDVAQRRLDRISQR
jgi:WD40 repeat protein